jgi:hypothetical protein
VAQFQGSRSASSSAARVGDKGEDVGEQGLRINVVEFCGLDESLHGSGAVGAPHAPA